MMRKIVFGFLVLVLVMISSCSQCNICKINADENNVCTNSVLDRAKAKGNCEKDGGEWLKIKN